MRISDWSSDVCSSDLHTVFTTRATGSLAGSQIRHDAWRHEPDHALGERDVESASLSGCSPPVQRRQNGHGSITPRQHEIGRASCRERVCPYVEILVVSVSLKKKKDNRKTTKLT